MQIVVGGAAFRHSRASLGRELRHPPPRGVGGTPVLHELGDGSRDRLARDQLMLLVLRRPAPSGHRRSPIEGPNRRPEGGE